MAALTSAGVTVEHRWQEGNPNGRRWKAVQALLVLSSQGGSTNTIAASLFGLTKIWQASMATGDDDKGYFFTPSYDGTKLYAHTALGGAPADITANVRVIVKGQE